MIVYHGSLDRVAHPDVVHSKRFIDFGPGFYVTSFKDQAERWARRKVMRVRKQAFVNVYEFSDDLGALRVKRFPDMDREWLDFVVSCRKGESVYSSYDVVIGKVADDQVFKCVDMYFRGIWEVERTLKEVRFYRSNDQIALLTQKAIDQTIDFKYAYEVGEHD